MIKEIPKALSEVLKEAPLGWRLAVHSDYRDGLKSAAKIKSEWEAEKTAAEIAKMSDEEFANNLNLLKK